MFFVKPVNKTQEIDVFGEIHKTKWRKIDVFGETRKTKTRTVDVFGEQRQENQIL